MSLVKGDVGLSNVDNTSDLNKPVSTATQAAIDAVAQGASYKTPCRVASTANIDLATGGLLTIDDSTLSEDDRVLVKDQTVQTENGIYLAKSGSWVRALDLDEDSEAIGAILVPVSEGTIHGNQIWDAKPQMTQ